jgi:formamidopyrimidine-DNA glycosylase
MPELPEVESVRRGLAEHLTGRRVTEVDVRHARAVRRHPAGAADLRARLVGRHLETPQRRGKYLWIPLVGCDEALVAHLGMSGQFRLAEPGAPEPKHLRVVLGLSDGREVWFIDQRTFGGLAVEPLEGHVPASVRHVALDPFDADYDLGETADRLRGRRTEVKRSLLDQTVVSGVGNIYADEALWRASLHPRRPTRSLTRSQARGLLQQAFDVMDEALAAGGTSFDALYVDVNGDGGYFERSLHAYGREGLPCDRCGTPIRRETFTNRSSAFCPRCQPAPRRRRLPTAGRAAPIE